MTTIFVAKLDFGVTENELMDLFRQFGTVSKVSVAKDKETNKSRGFAFVEMPNADEAQRAIEQLDGHSFNGRKCVIKEADSKPGQSSRPSNDNRPPRDNNREGGFRPRSEGQQRDSRNFQKPAGERSERPVKRDDFKVPHSDEDDESIGAAPIVKFPSIVKKKKEADKPRPFDETADGKNKKQKMNAYRKSGKDTFQFDDDDLDEEIDLFGRHEDEEIEEDVYSKYLVNHSDEEEEWDDDEEWDEEDEEEWDDDDEWEDDDY